MQSLKPIHKGPKVSACAGHPSEIFWQILVGKAFDTGAAVQHVRSIENTLD
jgi:hypothetical protein